LFDSDDGNIFDALLFSLINQVIVNLTSAKNDFLAFFGLDILVRLWDNSLELCARDKL